MAYSLLTVTTAATNTALTDMASVQAELSLTSPEDDSYLQAQISAASSAISSWCNRVFARESLQEMWRPESPVEVLMLSRTPVVAIASVVEDGITLSATEYEADLQAGLVWRLADDYRVKWSGRKITLLYSAGYILPSDAGRNLPQDIQRACVLLVTAQHNARGRDPMIRSESAQDVGQATYLDPRAGMEAMPPQAAALLSPYRCVLA